ncbi:4-hydroxy-3-methylbut-2-enyl diphosphate reductase [Rhodobium orientis]|uniref:4-hydroxy-3-methylbut-2-enyl diphosphate reductase n=1 Tax=Rhodobium orientis TaxID=34017 RepID=A0A327JP54_9HYPH|nr:4-hydroxy-3-methylbut-2-enyl diphosphate reductase [Rhodobium orientis]MBB4304234.1 4-hydroxy-3-methylbut-2-enyl diphosphate reductase [Rhodobium orientis]MBK5950703.1 4-hydroxy-3-methylbut-2-enyl diphosphate reductase [Rhodobium orientis]RAI28077.1 4-hydroxy-3-methylbut-2-enyl diphosphate reductase [Rhodobium orientis]
MTAQAPKQPLTLKLCAPRGFCAGVSRAIQIVEQALERYGAPVYVRHEIVHNKYVVDSLKQKGAIFVDELDEIPETDAPVIFSAHGVPKKVPAAAASRGLFFLDATCPLVSKVHKETILHHRRGKEVVLIGHRGHPEVVGTMGQVPDGSVHLVETVEDARTFQPKSPEALAFTTQTTLSVDDTAEIIAVLTERFPDITAPHREDICYATTNRQAAVKAVAPTVDAMVVVGAPNSSNTQRLREVAERLGCKRSVLVQRADDIDAASFADFATIGISAGASAPEVLVEEIIDAFARHFDVTVETVVTAEESMVFGLPRELREGVEA